MLSPKNREKFLYLKNSGQYDAEFKAESNNSAKIIIKNNNFIIFIVSFNYMDKQEIIKINEVLETFLTKEVNKVSLNNLAKDTAEQYAAEFAEIFK